ncbi:MAG: hypothetical protein HY000_25625 [Planctomycetes bacterium]|nr:hypothetical protein [Planctomycetota bacterium]
MPPNTHQSPEEKSRKWAAAAVVIVLLLYPASYGPVTNLWAYGFLPDPVIVAYAPLEWLAHRSSIAESTMRRYVLFLGADPGDDPAGKFTNTIAFVRLIDRWATGCHITAWGTSAGPSCLTDHPASRTLPACPLTC